MSERQTVTFKLDGDTVETLDEEAAEREITRSEYLRNIIKRRHRPEEIRSEYEERIDELEAEIADLERDLDRVQNEKQQLLPVRQDQKALREYLEEERRRRQQSLLTRAKWWLVGEPTDGEEVTHG